MILRDELTTYVNELLSASKIQDYCPNGLQVEGTSLIKRIVTGVTASQALIDKAIELQAQALFVHHGYFWKGEPEVITNVKKKRIQALLMHDLNLFAYHLPLDVHPHYGNNIQLGQRLELVDIAMFSTGTKLDLGMKGKLKKAMKPEAFSLYLLEVLGREPLHITSGKKEISTVAWCTGAAQDFIEAAAYQSVDAYISGEISERTPHLARELGIDYYAAGHHATERYGIEALGNHLAEKFGLEHYFIDIENPV